MTSNTARCQRAVVICLLATATLVVASAQQFATIATFDSSNGPEPVGAMAQGIDGNFYGATFIGGGVGTVFKVTPAGVLSTVYVFCHLNGCADGDGPLGGVTLGSDGNLYGTTIGPTTSTVFKLTPEGVLTTIATLASRVGYHPTAHGFYPEAALLEVDSGSFVGTASQGGGYNTGTVFGVSPQGTVATLHSFYYPGSGSDGASPAGALIQGSNGNLYGTTQGGGASLMGIIFELTPNGTLTILHSFAGPDGAAPYAGLTRAFDGNVYGATLGGGNANCYLGCGTVFAMTPAGVLTTLYRFGGQPDGANPGVALIQANNGSFYGTTESGGANNGGTIFEINPGGTLTTMYSFCAQPGCTDGSDPRGLIQGTDGSFYGTTEYGGANGDGTVFKLSLGLPPLVKIAPQSGAVGSNVIILGTDLSGATAVSFNGTAARFTVVSPTEITATVPAGATSGRFNVTTPGGQLLGGLFAVTP